MNLRGLLKYWLRNDTTQHGEFSQALKLAGRGCPRVIVDVGANDGFYGSNSFPFVARGWRALLIEPHPGAFAKLQRLHAARPNATCLQLACADTPGTLPLWIGADGDAGTLATLCNDDNEHFQKARTSTSVNVAVERLDAVLARREVPLDFGILSIDTEGMDYEVLLGLDLERWHPRVIITENYAPKDPPKTEYLARHGYRHRSQCHVNAFWTRDNA